MPRLDRPDRAGHAHVITLTGNRTLLDVKDLKVYFPVRNSGWFAGSKALRAVDGVSFTLRQGETLGIVGESGCGKSTLARAVLKLLPQTAGSVVWLTRDMSNISEADQRKLRKELQVVFQDPMASLDPRMTIGESISEPLRSLQPELGRDAIRARVKTAMTDVGLDPAWINRYPHEFSGGQNQRVGIARAMVVQPRLVICDEAVSALDVSIQAQIIDLIVKLQASSGMSLIFISHDLSVVRQISHRVMVLYLGRVVEFARPRRDLQGRAPSLYQGADLRRADPRPQDRAQQDACAAFRRPALAARQPRPAHLPQVEADRRSRRRAIPSQAHRSRARPFRRRA